MAKCISIGCFLQSAAETLLYHNDKAGVMFIAGCITAIFSLIVG